MADRDEALIDEAILSEAGRVLPNHEYDLAKRIVRHALTLERIRWQPPVDPDVLAVREIVAAYGIMLPEMAQQTMAGDFDSSPGFIAALAAYREHAAVIRRQCAEIARNFPAAQHGHLPTDPHKAAVQVAQEIAAAMEPANG